MEYGRTFTYTSTEADDINRELGWWPASEVQILDVTPDNEAPITEPLITSTERDSTLAQLIIEIGDELPEPSCDKCRYRFKRSTGDYACLVEGPPIRPLRKRKGCRAFRYANSVHDQVYRLAKCLKQTKTYALHVSTKRKERSEA